MLYHKLTQSLVLYGWGPFFCVLNIQYIEDLFPDFWIVPFLNINDRIFQLHSFLYWKLLKSSPKKLLTLFESYVAIMFIYIILYKKCEIYCLL